MTNRLFRNHTTRSVLTLKGLSYANPLLIHLKLNTSLILVNNNPPNFHRELANIISYISSKATRLRHKAKPNSSKQDIEEVYQFLDMIHDLARIGGDVTQDNQSLLKLLNQWLGEDIQIQQSAWPPFEIRKELESIRKKALGLLQTNS